jgi:hypothetical protein
MRLFLLLGLVVCSCTLSYGQGKRNRTTEFGPMLGASYYIGDLNQFTHYGKNTGPAGGFILRRNMNQRYSMRYSGFYGRVSGFDYRSNSASQQNRNLSFRSNIFEFAAGVEMNYQNFALGKSETFFSPYLFIQLAVFKMNPQANLNGQWVDLQPLGTEGQGTSQNSNRKYSLAQISIPFGAGVKLALSEYVGLSLEWGLRKTYTDYLDDVSGTYADPDMLADDNGPLAAILADRSAEQEGVGGNNTNFQRGNSNYKDWYVISGLTLTFKIGDRNVCPRAL